MKLDSIYKEEKKSAFAKLSEIIITMASRPSGLIGLSILVFHIILAFISPYIAPHDFKAIDPTLMLQAPSAEYWFGTDDLGRDVFTRTILGGRTALTITFFGSLIALLWGGLLGIFCGLVGGKIDDVVMRIVDAFLSIPWILAMLLIVSLLGTSTEVLIPALGFFYGKGIVRVARAATHDVIAKDFIVSARARGHSNFSIIWNDFNERFIELIKERFNVDSIRVKKLLNQTENGEIIIKSLLILSFCISNQGYLKLKNFLYDF